MPSIVFGLFGLGFFIQVVGRGLDTTFNGGEKVLGQPALIWAALTMALLTLPVVVVATEEALAAVPQSLRAAAFALGATRFQVVSTVVLPQAMAGILTGTILAISRGAGEVAPTSPESSDRSSAGTTRSTRTRSRSTSWRRRSWPRARPSRPTCASS